VLIKPSGARVYTPGGKPAKKSEYESFTSLSKWFDCPVSYFKHYSERVREPVSKELIFGRAWHGTVEDALVEKMWHGRNMAVNELQNRWHQRWLLELFLARDEMTWKGDQSPEDYFKLGLKLIETWRADYLPGLDPAGVEKSFWIEMTGLKRALYGKIDLMTVDGHLIDHKTSSRTYAELVKIGRVNPRDIDLQLAIYLGGYQSLTKSWPKTVELHRAVLSNPPVIERVIDTYTPEDVQLIFDTQIKPAIAEIERAWKLKSFVCICGKHKIPVEVLPDSDPKPAEEISAENSVPVKTQEARPDAADVPF
jgi:hypothetical protein